MQLQIMFILEIYIILINIYYSSAVKAACISISLISN
jgi:hypothetical protein